jgi:hypothetical protein
MDPLYFASLIYRLAQIRRDCLAGLFLLHNQGDIMKVYKLVRKLKNGSLKPLFIGKKQPFVIGQKMKCEFLPTKGFAPRSVDDKNSGGWHCCFRPVAPHLAETLKTGEERVWLECEAEGTTKTYHRGEHQGGDWILAEYITPLREVPWDEVRQMQEQYSNQHNTEEN